MIEAWASLRSCNTFGVEARARWLVRLRRLDELPDLLTRAEWRELPLLVLGAGSNVLLTQDFDGLVLRIDAERIGVSHWHGDDTVVRVEAGRNWHDFVQWSVEAGHGGIENLALIPGNVGAAPIQNIGAYGVELASVVDAVEVFDRELGDFAVLDREACAFAYRDSLFKRPAARRRYIVTAVRFRFRAGHQPVLDYPGVREELAGAPQTPASIAAAIARIRRRKLPDPATLGNAGSFFKNPVLDEPAARALAAAHPGLPLFPAGVGRLKLSAAWLIERLGWKGRRVGDAGVAPNHALVLVNHGGASGAAIRELGEAIRADVARSFGIALEIEPTVL